jgi:hypothetical protein
VRHLTEVGPAIPVPITGRERGVLAGQRRLDWGEMTGIIVSAALLIGGALLMLLFAMRS